MKLKHFDRINAEQVRIGSLVRVEESDDIDFRHRFEVRVIDIDNNIFTGFIVAMWAGEVDGAGNAMWNPQTLGGPKKIGDPITAEVRQIFMAN